MARFELLFPSKYLGSADLGGKDVTVKIATIKLEGIESQDEKGKKEMKQKAIVTLEGIAKPWLMNRTNAEAIVLLYGPETTGWKGKPITLHATMVDSFGEQVLAVRVKGSPLLKEPISKTIKRGRKKLHISLVPTSASGKPAPVRPEPAPATQPTEPQPADDFPAEQVAAAAASIRRKP